MDGALFANNGELIEYGGLPPLKSEYDENPPVEVMVYQESWYGAAGKAFSPGIRKQKLDAGVNRWVTSGGAVSVPSQNKGFYFSGMRNNETKGGPIYLLSYSNADSPNELSNTLVTVDMTTQQQEKWTNETLPSDVPPRAGAELAFVPVGEEGVLVAIGGVTDPIWDYTALTPDQTANSVSVVILLTRSLLCIF